MIRIENLEMVYPNGVTALHPTSLNYERGQFTVLLGTSGAGKSTLLRCLNFLNIPTNGKIVVEGIGNLTVSRKVLRPHRRKTAMIFQQHQLIDRHNALKNVLVAFLGNYSTLRSLFPLPQQDVQFALDCLDRVGLLSHAMTRVDKLSGGQKQRVGIARALSQRPQLILADEPVASLDPVTSEEVLSLLYRTTKEDGITAIVSLHQVELARNFADRVIGIYEGQVVFDGPPTQLTDSALEKIYGNKINNSASPEAGGLPEYILEPAYAN